MNKIDMSCTFSCGNLYHMSLVELGVEQTHSVGLYRLRRHPTFSCFKCRVGENAIWHWNPWSALMLIMLIDTRAKSGCLVYFSFTFTRIAHVQPHPLLYKLQLQIVARPGGDLSWLRHVSVCRVRLPDRAFHIWIDRIIRVLADAENGTRLPPLSTDFPSRQCGRAWICYSCSE